MKISPLAGKPADQDILVNIPCLVSAYYTGKPNTFIPGERVSFGTSGHRGSSFTTSFNENHILAITQAVCLYRKLHSINGPLYLGFDTHALSAPAYATTMEVLAANDVEIMISNNAEYTPTPAISHAIIHYNQHRQTGLADGIVLTPSHNPPGDGGFKYNPPNGGPAGNLVTKWIENKANEILQNQLQTVKRVSLDQALQAATTHRYDYLNSYINDLGNIIDMDSIRNSKLHMGVDPLGGAGVHYWEKIAEKYQLDLTVVNKIIDPTFHFMTVDWDGQIRMDPSSPYAMQRLISIKDDFDISFACDTDHDRHGIVTNRDGLLNPNHYLSAAVFYLLQNRPLWGVNSAIGKTIVTTQLIERIANKFHKKIFDVPVGFKWFVDGLLENSLCFCGEESAGSSFLRLDGSVWTTDKDGFILSLLSAEITAKTGTDPGELYNQLIQEFGEPFYARIENKTTPAQKEKLKNLASDDLLHKELAGEKIISICTKAPGNEAPMGGIKVNTQSGWFAARPSGTEDIYKIYAESFVSKEHLNKIIEEAQVIINAAL